MKTRVKGLALAALVFVAAAISISAVAAADQYQTKTSLNTQDRDRLMDGSGCDCPCTCDGTCGQVGNMTQTRLNAGTMLQCQNGTYGLDPLMQQERSQLRIQNATPSS